VPRLVPAALGFTAHLSLVANPTQIRTPVKRNVVRPTTQLSILGKLDKRFSAFWRCFITFNE
jgi:hypothetical protein